MTISYGCFWCVLKKFSKNYGKLNVKYDKILKDNFTREEVMINMAKKATKTSGKINKQREIEKKKRKIKKLC